VVENTQKIVKFIWLRHVPLALFRKHVAILAQGLSLLNPSATRFATNFLMVARILDLKEALKQTMTDLEWNTYIRTLSDMQKKPVRTQAQEVRKLILSDDFEFWQSSTNYCIVMKAAVAMLMQFNGKQPCKDNVYIIMRALHHYVVACLTPFQHAKPSCRSCRDCLQKEISLDF
jgi:hypothetical protein